MTYEEAIELLTLHNFSHDDLEHPKMQSGFVRMLRPFDGNLNEENFNEVMAAINCLAHKLQEDYIDRRILANILGICQSIWLWALTPEGMLQRNKLLSEDQICLLTQWFDSIFNRLVELVELHVIEPKE